MIPFIIGNHLATVLSMALAKLFSPHHLRRNWSLTPRQMLCTSPQALWSHRMSESSCPAPSVVRGDCCTDNSVTSPSGGEDTAWFVVGEDWWTAIATLFLCKINSTCRSALYEWWRPPQAIHTAAQRHGSGLHRTYKAGIEQSLFPAGPCIIHRHPHMKHTHMNTQINQEGPTLVVCLQGG